MRASMNWAAVGLLLLGLGGVGWSANSWLLNRDLATEGSRATVTRIERPSRSRNRAAWFRAGGAEYRCYDRALQPGDLVVYDPADPTRNRANLYAGGLNEQERWLLSFGGAAVFAAIVIWVFERFMTHPDERAWFRAF